MYMFSDILPPLAGLSRAFQKHDIDFTVVKPLVVGTKAAIDALLLSPGDCFSSLPTVLPELKQFGVQQPTDHQVEEFKQHVYNKYLITLSHHITNRFPDMSLLEGFSIFDPSAIPLDLSLQPNHGSENLQVLIDHYGTHNIIDSQATKTELRTFNSVVASNSELKQLTIQQLMRHVIKPPEYNVMFPNLFKLAAIGLLLPMSTVDCERGFSTLSCVKTDLRNRLSNRILNHFLMILMEGPLPADFPYDIACDIWGEMQNRWIQVNV